jgi:hypothetical protein
MYGSGASATREPFGRHILIDLLPYKLTGSLESEFFCNLLKLPGYCFRFQDVISLNLKFDVLRNPIARPASPRIANTQVPGSGTGATPKLN